MCATFIYFFLYFGNGFELLLRTKILLLVVQTEKAILILLQLQLATEVTNKITDRDQIIVDIEGSNETMLCSMTNSLIIKVVVVTVYRKKKKKDFFEED